MVLTVFGLVTSCYSVFILNFDQKIKQTVVRHALDTSIFSSFVLLIIGAYFTAGVGFVVQGTFLPEIINSLKGLDGVGNLTWTLTGLAGIPSCVLWMRFAAKKGSVNVILVALLVQMLGILIPALTTNMYLNLFSGVLYGGTFIGIVGLFMNLGGKIAGKNPVVLMGTLTTSYGIGQVVAPLYAVHLFDRFGNYDYALYLTAFIVFIGILLMLIAKAKMTEQHKIL